MPKYNPTIQKNPNNKKWLRSNAGTWLFFLGGHLHPAITRTCGRVSLCYIYCALRPNWSRRTSAAADAAALTRLKAAHSVKSMLACAPNTFYFFFFFCPTGKLKTPRALSDFFFSSSSFVFFVFLHDTYSTELLPPPQSPLPAWYCFLCRAYFTSRTTFLNGREREKKQKKRCLLTFYPLLTLTERDSEMDFDRRGLLRNGESRSEV